MYALKFGIYFSSGHSSLLGKGQRYAISLNVSSSDPPLKGDFPSVSNSAKMQPADHTSIFAVYFRSPRNSSGARYQRVTTFVVRCLCLSKSRYFARPKSQSLTWPCCETRMLLPFISLCKHPISCKYARPSSICFRIHLS